MDKKTNNWKTKKLGEVCKLKNGFAFKSDNYLDNGIPVIRISDIKDGLIVPRNTVYVSEDSVYDNYIINENEIIVAMSGATTGKFGIYKSKEKAYQNQRVGKFDIIDKKQLDNNFLLHQLHSLKRQIEKDAYGGAQPNISSKKIEEMEIVLPPLETQHAIVSKIEELFSELDKGIAELKTAQLQLKTYRQSVLKSAFEGKLTNENVKHGELPDGWKSKSLKDLVLKVEKVKRKEVDENEGLIYLDIGGINNNSNRIENYKKYFWKDAPSRAQQIVKQNDILFSTVRTYMKNIAIVDKEIYNNQIASSGFTVLRADSCVNYKYIYYNTISDVFLNPLNELQTGTSYPAVRDSDVLSQTINLPLSPEEQHRIVQEIESRLSVADKMEQSIQESLQKAEALRQSILKKAFCGELV